MLRIDIKLMEHLLHIAHKCYCMQSESAEYPNEAVDLVWALK